jgi:murein DD-endopeptidase MepM/ murein hydrolase activator NlpD
MRRPLLLVLAGALAFALAPAALAHTDGPRQLSFVWPADGTVTSPFGRDGMRWHTGLDIGILTSLQVRAAAQGTVIAVGERAGFEGYGRIVEVDVGTGFVTLYAHLQSWSVRVGDYVLQGDPLGVAGCTGWCTGTHLHFEVRLDGRAIDPSPLIGA